MTSVISEVFGRMLSASQIEEAVVAAMKKWYPTYLREQENQMELPEFTLPIPQNYSDRNKFDMEAPEELPKIVVIAPGTVGAPRKGGGGIYSAVWRLGVGIAIGADNEVDANRLVKAFGAATRGLMMQSSELGPLGAIDIEWTDELYEDLPVPNAVQLVKAASLYFNIDFHDVITRGHGPLVPDSQPYTIPEFETADVTLEQESIG